MAAIFSLGVVYSTSSNIVGSIAAKEFADDVLGSPDTILYAHARAGNASPVLATLGEGNISPRARTRVLEIAVCIGDERMYDLVNETIPQAQRKRMIEVAVEVGNIPFIDKLIDAGETVSVETLDALLYVGGLPNTPEVVGKLREHGLSRADMLAYVEARTDACADAEICAAIRSLPV